MLPLKRAPYHSEQSFFLFLARVFEPLSFFSKDFWYSAAISLRVLFLRRGGYSLFVQEKEGQGSGFLGASERTACVSELSAPKSRNSRQGSCDGCLATGGVFRSGRSGKGGSLSEGRGCLEEGCLGLPGVFPDIG